MTLLLLLMLCLCSVPLLLAVTGFLYGCWQHRTRLWRLVCVRMTAWMLTSGVVTLMICLWLSRLFDGAPSPPQQEVTAPERGSASGVLTSSQLVLGSPTSTMYVEITPSAVFHNMIVHQEGVSNAIALTGMDDTLQIRNNTIYGNETGTSTANTSTTGVQTLAPRER